MELIKIEDGTLAPEFASTLAEFERYAKWLEDKRKTIKKGLLEVMELSGAVRLESDELIITYIAETDRETFDSKAFRKDNPDLYDKYVSISKVRPSIRIKLKEE